MSSFSSLMFEAARSGNIDYIRENFHREGFFHDDCLVAAVSNNHLDVVELFLTSPESNILWALSAASKRGRVEMVKLLLTKLKPEDGVEEALKDADEGGHLRVVKILFDSGRYDEKRLSLRLISIRKMLDE